jgi:ubiquinone/menaquinone biosynthesis C-methylase UbiE
MIDASTVRAVALALPEAIEQEHHGRASFRVAGKIFATLWDTGHANLMRRAILEALALGPGDRLLEIGCGGGLLLREAMASGAEAIGIDHSDEMVSLARERAPGAEILLASAERLPFPAAHFTAVAMSVVFFFLPDPGSVLRECRRTMTTDGRLAVYTTSPKLRGTPAAPEPLASHSHFYTDEALVTLARRAGFATPVVVDDQGAQLLTARG